MRIFYDTEFIENGRTINLISIALVREDGHELYLVNRDMPIRQIRRHPWLMANVVPHLPQPHGDRILHQPARWLFDYTHPTVHRRAEIASRVREFITSTPEPELWADYAAYDHVVLAQLYGPMINLPHGIPMWTNDLRTEISRRGNPALPEQQHGVHDALADARHLRDLARHLGFVAAASGYTGCPGCLWPAHDGITCTENASVLRSTYETD